MIEYIVVGAFALVYVWLLMKMHKERNRASFMTEDGQRSFDRDKQSVGTHLHRNGRTARSVKR